MKNNRNPTPFLTLLLLCVCAGFSVAAQHTMRAIVGRVSQSGFYAVPISPQLSAWLRPDLADLRIRDTGSAYFAPWIVRRTPHIAQRNQFDEFPITSVRTDSGYTIADIENPDASGITSLTLLIGNTAVERYTAISGSNNGHQWYIIDEQILFLRSYDNVTGNYSQTINIPLSKYRYYRLRINNAHTDPLNILRAGRYQHTDSVISADFVTNPAPAIWQKDTGNVSIIHLRNTMPWHTSRISMSFTGPRFWQRTAQAFVSASDTGDMLWPVASFAISSSAPSVIDIPAQNAARIHIVVHNADNPPLRVAAATTAMRTQQVVVWLAAGKYYELLAGAPQATMPDYDLSHFRDSLPDAIPTLQVEPLQPIERKVATAVAPAPSRLNWMWAAIIGAVIIMSLFTWRLLQDVRRKGAGE
jgi:hypothetical protein